MISVKKTKDQCALNAKKMASDNLVPKVSYIGTLFLISLSFIYITFLNIVIIVTVIIQNNKIV